MTESQDHPALHAYANIPAFVFDWQVTSIPPFSGQGEMLGHEGHILDSVALFPRGFSPGRCCAHVCIHGGICVFALGNPPSLIKSCLLCLPHPHQRVSG
ncbi:hypothetical protein QQF64_011920 [Cirrhinus molitorella]|uniref:Uncharacterized protein n=1 Tax=Cirrhinus molitorella TaxID=172907 RepID=A0ABR3LVK3_9TELE